MTGAARGAKSRGCKAERLLKDWLRARGYEAVRSAGSHGRADVYVVNHKMIGCGLELKHTKRKPRPSELFVTPPKGIRVAWYVFGVWWPVGAKLEDALLWPSRELYDDGDVYALGAWFPDLSDEVVL